MFNAYLEWVKTVPDELTSALRIMHFPPTPDLPPQLRGTSAIVLMACYNGEGSSCVTLDSNDEAGSIGRFAAFEELSDDDWANLFNVNLFSAVRITRAVLPAMRKQHWGRIINMASESGIQPDPEMPHYNASKAAMINLTKSLSL